MGSDEGVGRADRQKQPKKFFFFVFFKVRDIYQDAFNRVFFFLHIILLMIFFFLCIWYI